MYSAYSPLGLGVGFGASGATGLSAPPVTSGLVYWLDAARTTHSGDGTAVTAAVDRSGAGNVIVEGSAGNGPTYEANGFGDGKPSLLFGVSGGKWLKSVGGPAGTLLAGQPAATKRFTVVQFVEPRRKGSITYWSFSSSLASSRYLICRHLSSTNKFSIIGGTALSSPQAEISCPDEWTPFPILHIYRFDGANDVHRIDGVNSAPQPRAYTGVYDAGTNSFSLGAQNSPSPAVSGWARVAQTLVYDHDLTDAECVRLEREWLAAYYPILAWKAGLGATGSTLVCVKMGQSNERGGLITTPTYAFDAPNTFMLGANGLYRPLTEPSGIALSPVPIDISLNDSLVGASCAGGMAERLRALGETMKMLFVPCAKESSTSTQWANTLTSSPIDIATLIGWTKARIREAQKAPGAKFVITVDQGEADTSPLTSGYRTNWINIILEMISWIGAGNFYKPSCKVIFDKFGSKILTGFNSTTWADLLNEQEGVVSALSSDVKKVVRVDPDDHLHLSAELQRLHGANRADVLWAA